jgi:hypothetical protein
MLSRPDVRPHVTPALLATLDGGGSFVLPPPASFGAMPVIAPERARAIAHASLPVRIPIWNDILSRARLPKIDPRRISLSPDVWYADTPHEPLAPEYLHEQVYAGPWYVMHAGVDGEPQVAIEVSALATDVMIERGRFPAPGSALQYVHGLPRPGVALLASPEAAVVHLCAATGAKVTEAPVLLRRSGGWAAAASLWRLALDRRIEVVTTDTTGNSAAGGRSRERVIFVGPGLSLYVPSPDQGPVARMPPLSGGRECVELPLRPGMAQRYDEVGLVG